jgi:hypothetical protein
MVTKICQVFHSSRTRWGWAVIEGGETLSRHQYQKQAEAAATAACRKAWLTGDLAQAVLHKKDGTIRTKRTYGKAPQPHPAGDSLQPVFHTSPY